MCPLYCNVLSSLLQRSGVLFFLSQTSCFFMWVILPIKYENPEVTHISHHQLVHPSLHSHRVFTLLIALIASTAVFFSPPTVPLCIQSI